MLFLHFNFVRLPLTNSIFVSHGTLTKLAVAVILPLLLLLPALAYAEGIMCEVGLCGEEEGKQRTGWRDEKKRVTVCHSGVIRGKGQGCDYKTQASHSSAWDWGEVVCVTGSQPCYILHLNYGVRAFSLALQIGFLIVCRSQKDCTQRETLTARFEGRGCN